MEREAMLSRVSSAFAREDHDSVLVAMTPDIEIVVPGNTSFAGTYRGKDEVLEWLLTMRQAFVPAEQPIEFSHAGNDMAVRQVAIVGGRHWMNSFRFTFDGPLIERIVWEPEDIETFDALIERVISMPSRASA